MKTATAGAVLRWLVRDTFRQSLATGIFWLMLGLSAACAGICLTTRVEGDALAVADGVLRVPLDAGIAPAVRQLEAELAAWGAGAGCLLLALLWTAGLLPSFLDPCAVTVLLAKPVPRWAVLAGKLVGVLVFVAFQDAVFVAGTWLAVGLRTGVWEADYFLCLPLLLLHFLTYFAFAAMLAVATRSVVACFFGSLVFWLLSWAVNWCRHVLLFSTELGPLPPGVTRLTDLGYWLLPKPNDFYHLMLQTVERGAAAVPAPAAGTPLFGLLSSLVLGLGLLGIVAYDFVTAEY